MKRGLFLLALLGCTGSPADVEPPGPLQAGVARVRMPVPLGIGTVGFGGFGVDADPSPFAEIYPATTRIHGHPEFKVVALSRGPGHELVFVRSDTVGIFQQIRRAVVLEVQERTGRDLDDALLIGGTHTHSGPGRVIDGGGPFDLIADRFLPPFYDNLIGAIADGVVAALDDLRPARVGWTTTEVTAHNDRRCEDGLDYTDDALPMLAVERDGEIDALVMAYAIHGTVLGIEELTLSQDVMGAIEEAVEDRFDHPVQVLGFNSWGADMSPGSPVVDEGEGAQQPDGYDRMERIGLTVADAVEAAIPDLVMDDAPDIGLRTWRTRIDRAVIGYAPGEFPYEYGGVYCGQGLDADCDASTTLPTLDQLCLPFPADYPAPNQTLLSFGHVGDLYLLTFPGEPGTLLAEGILEQARTHDEVRGTMFLGYTQDYLGYSILEDDWWQGGYEAGGALWGPRQGAFLSARARQMFDQTLVPVAGSALERQQPGPVTTFDVSSYTPYLPTPPVEVGTVQTDVEPAYGPTDTVTFVVRGSDPWLGAPLAVLEHEDGTPVLRPGGMPWDSDSYAFWLDLTTDPTYADALETPSRTFSWHFRMPARHRVIGAGPDLLGRYRLRVSVPTDAGSVDVVSQVFEVTAG